MSKKRFGISAAVNTALTQTIQMAEAENSPFFNTEILINRITLDPDNPRKHKITLHDLRSGLSVSDTHYHIKKEEYEGLCELAESIKKEGLLHPIAVIEDGGNFKLVAGERRFFATIIANKKVIEARVFRKKPKTLDLKVIQWTENQSRKDLSLYEKLMNVAAITEAYRLEKNEELTAIKLSEIMSVSRAQAQFYRAILSNVDLMSFIQNGKITTLELARQLVSNTAEQIQTKLNAATESKNSKTIIKKPVKDKSKNAGRKRVAVNLGITRKPLVAKTIIESVLSTHQFQKHTAYFQPVDWACLDQSTKAFQKLIRIMEAELEVLV